MGLLSVNVNHRFLNPFFATDCTSTVSFLWCRHLCEGQEDLGALGWVEKLGILTKFLHNLRE